jgi:hypothetical protein
VPGEVGTTTEDGVPKSRFWDLGEQEQQSRRPRVAENYPPLAHNQKGKLREGLFFQF